MRVRPIRSSEIHGCAPGGARRVSTRVLAVRLLTAAAAVVLAGALLGGALAPRGDAAATISAQLVKDIYPGNDSGDPSDFAVIGSTLFLRATDSHEAELWKSDGSAAGTVMVKDINTVTGSGGPEYLTAMNGNLYFTADDGSHGRELWKSDGTEAGTIMVKDINSGIGSSDPSWLTVSNGSLYFRATDGSSSHGIELWKSDGTEAGTVIVKDINPGSGNSYPWYLTAAGGALYFQATDGTNGVELWKSDGTSGGTSMVKNINPGSADSYPSGLIAFNGNVYFSASDGTGIGQHGAELWETDGTGPGTSMVKDIDTYDTGGSDPYGFIAIGASLFFVATDGSNNHGVELWKSDGTGPGTFMVKDINLGNADGDPSALTAFNGSLFFRATDGSSSHGYELWKSDGTDAGTSMVKDINSGSADGYPSGLTAFNGGLYFEATDGTLGYELWKSDGTAAGTVLVGDINVGSGDSFPSELTPMGTNLYFRATDSAHGSELWRAGDYSPPETQIDSGPSGTITSSSASFSFYADEAATFQCALDGAAMSACTSPKALSGLAIGSHSFQVRATDLVGNVDASPASRTFTVAAATTTTTTTTTTTPPPPPTYPQTRITKHPKKVVLTSATKASAVFKFTSSKKGSHFSCKLDKGKWASCRSPKAYKVKRGKHTFQVRATYAGHTDRTPAKWTWTVKRK